MKNLIAAILLVTFSTSSFSYCEEVYLKQAKINMKKSENNQVLREGLVTGAAFLGAVAGGSVMMATGAEAIEFLATLGMVGAPLVASKTVETLRDYYKKESLEHNSPYHIYLSIRLADAGQSSSKLIEELNKRGLKYDQQSEDKKLAIHKEIASIIKSANANDELCSPDLASIIKSANSKDEHCSVEKDGNALLSYRKFSDFVAKKMGLKPLKLMRM